jgi:hypothetical protein
MGVGLLTQMTTPLVYASVLVAVAQGLTWAVVAGAAFGLGRSAPAFAAPWLGARVLPGMVFEYMVRQARKARYAGGVVTLVGLSALFLPPR